MKKNPKVSIVIPIYNVEKYLRRCLDSVANQTFTDWQAICVNDGSPDKSADIAREYAARDKRFVVIDKENGGLSDARNVGVKHATGEYILFIDSDDFIHHQALELTYKAAMKKNADMVLFHQDKKTHDDLKQKMLRGEDVSGLQPKQKNITINKVRLHQVKNIIFHATEKNHTWHVRRPVRRHCFVVLGLYRTELIKNIPFIKGIIIEDFPWWVSVLMARPKTVMINTPLYFYMPNSGSILNSSKALFMARSLTVGLKKSFDLYKQNATVAEFKHFNREFLWPFAITMMQKLRELDNDKDRKLAARDVKKLLDDGVFDMPSNGRAKKYKRRIENFIHQFS